MKNWEYNEKAFPAGLDEVGGMTLRDYFAAKAMQGMLSNGFTPVTREFNISNGSYAPDWAAISYQMADAMLAERKKNEPAQQMQAASP